MSTGTTQARPRTRVRVAVAAAAALALAFPLPATAADPDVTFDPDTPAGKEYAIPLQQGRAEGAGTEDQKAAANTPFGVGVKPRDGGGKGGGGDGGTGGAASPGRDGSASGRSGASDASGSRSGAGADRGARPRGGGSGMDRELRNRIARAEEPGDTGLWTLGIALAVVLSAILFGLLLRSRREPAAG